MTKRKDIQNKRRTCLQQYVFGYPNQRISITRFHNPPVTPTTSPMLFSRFTSACLSVGEERASTWSVGRIARCCAGESARNSRPSMARPPGVKMPHSEAMALAVTRLSPVTMRTCRCKISGLFRVWFWGFSQVFVSQREMIVFPESTEQILRFTRRRWLWP